jgi:hypothetical protein
MSRNRCDQCGAEILWATNRATQKRAPLDAHQVRDDYGNLHLEGDKYVVLDPEVAAGARARGFRLYTNHLGTCPARERDTRGDTA